MPMPAILKLRNFSFSNAFVPALHSKKSVNRKSARNAAMSTSVFLAQAKFSANEYILSIYLYLTYTLIRSCTLAALNRHCARA